MKNILNFLLEVGKLKKIPRRGWVINQIKNPESVAGHIFRATIMAWILGKEKGNLIVEKLLKIALIHDLCEVYAGDTTPYDGIIPRSKKRLRELMKTWPRFSPIEKRKKILEKQKREEIAIEKLILNLPPDLKIEIKNHWLDYEKGLTPEGRFFHQADRMENFLQSYEYWRKYKNPPLGPWWLWAREFFDDPLLIKFMEGLEKKFHGGKKENNRIMELIDFFIGVGKLKTIKRKGIMFYGVKDPETTAEHTFRMIILAWILGRIDKKLNMEKAIKMSLIHDLCEIYAGSITPYDGLLPENKKKRYKFVREWPPRSSTKKKEKIYSQKFKKEKHSLERLIKKLSPQLRKEILNLWLDYETGSSREGRFVRQVDRAENLLGALDCWQKNKNFPTKPWWQHAEEVIDNPIILKFLDEISKRELKIE